MTNMDWGLVKSLGKDQLLVYTDGSCYWRDKIGGIGAIIFNRFNIDAIHFSTFKFGFKSTTISRMEWLALISALELCQGDFQDSEIHLVSDSEYVVNSINIWRERWKEYKYIGVKNTDLLLKFEDLENRFANVKVSWTRGHKIKPNKIADKLARGGRKFALDNPFSNDIVEDLKFKQTNLNIFYSKLRNIYYLDWKPFNDW